MLKEWGKIAYLYKQKIIYLINSAFSENMEQSIKADKVYLSQLNCEPFWTCYLGQILPQFHSSAILKLNLEDWIFWRILINLNRC